MSPLKCEPQVTGLICTQLTSVCPAAVMNHPLTEAEAPREEHQPLLREVAGSQFATGHPPVKSVQIKPPTLGSVLRGGGGAVLLKNSKEGHTNTVCTLCISGGHSANNANTLPRSRDSFTARFSVASDKKQSQLRTIPIGVFLHRLFRCPDGTHVLVADRYGANMLSCVIFKQRQPSLQFILAAFMKIDSEKVFAAVAGPQLHRAPFVGLPTTTAARRPWKPYTPY